VKYGYNRLKYIRVQRLINIKIATAFRTTSSEALCTIAGTIPIIIRTEMAVRQYYIRKGLGDTRSPVDMEVEPKNWPHPAEIATVIEINEYEDKNIKMFTDGSKTEKGVGAGVAIFRGTELVTQLKYRLDSKCSNNQAEQLAIVKALEALESLNIDENSPRTAAVITDSRVALDSIKNIRNHSFLIEEIRLRLLKLRGNNWNIAFSWVKAHAGNRGNELADKIAKSAAMDDENENSYNRIPRSAKYKELEDEMIIKWEKEWEETPKAALTKQFFPIVSGRFKAKLQVTPNLTALVTGHGKTRAYLHRFKLQESPTCPCGKEQQTTDHLIYRCILLQQEREKLKRVTTKQGSWPTDKQDLINKHLKQFTEFANSIDFESL
jgi:ribonuclease HI